MDKINEFLQSDFVTTQLIPWAVSLVVALLIFFIGRWIAGKIVNISKRMMARGGMDSMLSNFLGNILYTLLIAVVIIAALDHLGIQTTSLLAVLGAAGLAVGLALKDSLANFSSGVMLIVFRPFREGDYVEAGGVAGTVENVGIFATTMLTPDNREIIVPNGQIYGGTITNVTARETRRLDLVVGISYSDDIRKARELVMEIINQEERILKDPAPVVNVAALGESSIDLNVRPWVNKGDYWNVRADLLETIKTRFDENGISIPFPQQDVYMHEVKSA
ncbi:mechanosensitive ion channel protein MscS [Thiohalobacter thiocyanaticus]|uniref:Small-conductance mechanosensitive channel n=1 Tax=Thiohalobacter thiocyanaticus TaxID=585455 RepID=A0A1Z4VTB6_9GAMM|nr:mechanosensitive ion channel domain-containing protein [Thiohalobacter thiocyanaticus]BAZ94568.1 mechanosensitive ion channel protein MscS [Thiohalobacter thiocyanaticus]